MLAPPPTMRYSPLEETYAAEPATGFWPTSRWLSKRPMPAGVSGACAQPAPDQRTMAAKAATRDAARSSCERAWSKAHMVNWAATLLALLLFGEEKRAP